jgi:hypothetical protein
MPPGETQLSLVNELLTDVPYNGYVLSFDLPVPRSTLRALIAEKEPFEGVLNVGRMAAGETGMCLIAAEGGRVTHAALIQKIRSYRASLGSPVRLLDFVEVKPVTLARLARMSSVDLPAVAASASGKEGRPLGPTAWAAVFTALRRVNPDRAEALAQLEARCRRLQKQRRDDSVEIMVMERDAIGLVLDFAQHDRPRLLAEEFPLDVQNPRPALALGRRRNVNEEELLARDMEVFHDWVRFPELESKRNSVSFETEGSRVTVVYAHRNEFEDTAGVDLIYFHDRFNSFVMVQYKKVRREGPSEALAYRFGGSYEDEMERMQRLKSHALLNQELRHLNDFRLHGGAFYFKLCDPLNERISPRDLVPGFYFPLDYWEYVLGSGQATGKRGGRVIAPKQHRYLNNTLFVDLVRDGWIGSVSRDLRDLDALVEESLAEGRSVIGARKTPKR